MIYNLNLATKITLLRIFLTPYVVMTILHQQWMIACMLSLIAVVTDYLDGYCARWYHQETEFGKILDPVADKIFIFGSLLALHRVFGSDMIPTWFMMILAIKEVVLMFGALFLLKNNYKIITPSMYAKVITALLMILIVYIIVAHCFMTNFMMMDDDIIVNVCKLLTICSLGICVDYGYKFYTIVLRV